MSIVKRRNVLLVSLTTLALTACGVGSTPVSTDDQALTPVAQQPVSRLTPTRAEAQLPDALELKRPFGSLQAPSNVVIAHSLNAPDGTQVEFILGMIGCGFWEVASGTTTVVNGRFEVPFDAEQTGGIESLSLYFRTGTAACDADDASTQLRVIGAPLPGSVDVSTAEVVGCSVFGW